MHKKLFDHLYETQVQKPNIKVLQGINDEQSLYTLDILRKHMTAYSSEWPEWFKLLEIRRADPWEAVNSILGRTGRIKIDNSKTSAFLCLFSFEIAGEIINRYIWIPYLENSILELRGVSYQVSVVLKDALFSIEKETEKIFLKANHKKITFEREDYAYVLDEYIRHDSVSYTSLYMNTQVTKDRGGKETPQYVTMNATLAHYLCSRYGLQKASKEFFGVDIHVGKVDHITVMDFPEEDYHIAAILNPQNKPKCFKKELSGDYCPPDLRIAWSKEQSSLGFKRFIAGCLYVVQRHGGFLTSESINDPESWTIVLGRVLLTYSISEMSRANSVKAHLDVIQIYLDDDKRSIFNSYEYFKGRPIEDFHDVMFHILCNAPEMIMYSDPGSLFGKTVSTVETILGPLLYVFGKLSLGFFDPNKGNKIAPAKLATDLKKITFPDAWVKQFKADIGTKHGEVKSLDSTVSCKAVKVTTAMISQDDCQGSKKSIDITEKSKYFTHPSIIGIGSPMVQPKYRPDGRSHLNAHVLIDHNWVIKPSVALNPLYVYMPKVL